MAKGSFGSSITSDRISDSIIFNNITAEGTLDVSSGTLTTSTAQQQAIVDGATIAVEAQDLSSGTGTTLPNSVQDNITRLGSVTTGTIDHNVSMTGVPRRTALYEVKPSAGNLQVNDTSETIGWGSISLSTVSGRTYCIESSISVQLYNSGYISARIRMYKGTSAKSRGATDTSNFGTILNLKEVAGHNIAAANSFKFMAHVVGIFTASSTQTEYIHFSIQNANLSTTSLFKLNTSYPETIIKIQEYDSDNFTTITS